MSDATDAGPEGHVPEFVQLWQMLEGYQVSQALAVAARLGIARKLTGGPRSSLDLAADTGTHAPSLYRLLRALSGVGLFTELPDGCFELTSLGHIFAGGTPGPAAEYAALVTAPAMWQPWSDLLYSVTTGHPAFDHVFGTSFWAYHEQHDEAGRDFNAGMAAAAARRPAALAAACDLSGVRTLVDVGGGRGAQLAAILRANPGMRGILLDQPHVVAEARPVLGSAGVADRCALVGGDMFEAVPAGDAQLLSCVLHNLDDGPATAVLQNCRRSLAEHGRLLVVDAVLPEGGSMHPGAFLDLRMLVLTGGRERTESEFRRLLGAAGFDLVRVAPMPWAVPFSLVEGAPAL